MPDLYTCGIWTAKPGREDEFVAAWKELAEWTFANVEGTSWVKLLQSTEQPNRFISVGPWESEEAIAGWRASEGFQQRVGALRDLLESFEPGTYSARLELGS